MVVHRVPSRVGRRTSARAKRLLAGSAGNGADVFMNKAAERAPLGNPSSGGILRLIYVSVGVCGCCIDHRVWRRRRKMSIQRVFSVHRGVDCGHLPGRRQLGMERPWLALSMDGREKPYLGANGMIDFAGSGIVHMTGGVAALVNGAIFLGPRTGRFSPSGETVDMPGHSSVLVALGTFILWFGWYGFNPVSTLAFEYMETASRVAVTILIERRGWRRLTLSIHYFLTKSLDVGPMCNGILAGLVSVTGNCVVVEPWAAALIGLIGGCIYYGSSTLLKKLKIDDRSMPLLSTVSAALGASLPPVSSPRRNMSSTTTVAWAVRTTTALSTAAAVNNSATKSSASSP